MKHISLYVAIITFMAVFTPLVQADEFVYSSTFLYGAQEVPPVESSMTGSFSTKADSTIHYTLHVYNAHDVTAAHLHCGAPGKNGPIVAFLHGKDEHSQLNGTVTISGNIDSIEPTATACSPAITSKDGLIQAMKDGIIYANVHTVEHPAGEIRGQVSVFDTVSGSIPSIQADPQMEAFIEDLRTKQDELMNKMNHDHEELLRSSIMHL